jgi:ABC-type uncharacterized transport system fused permease/ATPase subunit
MSMSPDDNDVDQHRQWLRFWESAFGFWRRPSAWRIWLLSGSLVAIVIVQLYVQYQFNYWNRDFFDALERRDGRALQYQALLLLPLCAASITLAIASIWGRMTAQRKWREWLTTHLIRYWFEDGHYNRLAHVHGEHKIPEYRIAEDARIATDAPVDFALGLLSSLLSAIVFIQILWNVGGAAEMSVFGQTAWIPGYLVVSVVIYSGIVTGAMIVAGWQLTRVVQIRNQKEAELITAAHAVRDVGEGIAPKRSGPEVQRSLWEALADALLQWRHLCWQLMRITLVSHTNFLLAPIIGLVLCAPKFLAGTMTLGELTQAAAAFTMVQSSFNYLVDNYGRVADWLSSLERVGGLLLALDQLNHSGQTAVHKEKEAALAVAPISRS